MQSNRLKTINLITEKPKKARSWLSPAYGDHKPAKQCSTVRCRPNNQGRRGNV